jgi:hypothetical protein
MAKKKNSSRDTSLLTVVLSEDKLPADCVPMTDYSDRPYTDKTDQRKFLYNQSYRGQIASWVVYPNGRHVQNAVLWVIKSEADAMLAKGLAALQAVAVLEELGPPAPTPPAANSRLVMALESIAGSLEVIAEVAIAHDRPAPSVIRQPSINGSGPSPF